MIFCPDKCYWNWQLLGELTNILSILQASALLALPIIFVARVFSAVFWSVFNVIFKICALIYFLLIWMSSLLHMFLELNSNVFYFLQQ